MGLDTPFLLWYQNVDSHFLSRSSTHNEFFFFVNNKGALNETTHMIYS